MDVLEFTCVKVIPSSLFPVKLILSFSQYIITGSSPERRVHIIWMDSPSKFSGGTTKGMITGFAAGETALVKVDDRESNI